MVSVRHHFSKFRKTKQLSIENSDRYWRDYGVWPSGSLIALISCLYFTWRLTKQLYISSSFFKEVCNNVEQTKLSSRQYFHVPYTDFFCPLFSDGGSKKKFQPQERFQNSSYVKVTKCSFFLIHSADPQSRPAGSDHCFCTCHLSVRPHFSKENKFQTKTMFTTGETVRASGRVDH